ncbi:succinate dehydrogenase, cytochrome b556 subunit [Reinekea marinisedimentorum]|uniref:Succinate dehydrogenase cytochrome b556 subunit n=1 Tax=Reinekea marinisedimentorum TaxID=230495 RepID=A0A4V2UK14_9GAMM|nr:succinate dehydrogenase, cytochrome b556 subunit [Reinekea marinisedimentorum]TCS42456.1 succinate dehydrogenase / fumarate reductase cytochrome b subunit [Reinekea marinisedimentorum]
MKNNRPVNLDLRTIRLPVSAVASIIHRITGVGLFVALAFLMWALNLSLSSEAGFEKVVSAMNHPLAKLVTWGIVSFFAYHLIAGIKHLFMDIGYFEEKESGALASKFVLIASVICILLLGVWVW